MGKTFYIKTFGCQMNVADSERMTALLGETGMVPAERPEEANVIIVNGCTVREKAVHKAVSMLGGFAQIKRRREAGEGPLIGVGGCVGQLEKQTLFKRAPYLDFVFGTDTIDNLPELLSRVENGERHVVYADFDRSMNYSTETKVAKAQAQAYVNIMKGCDKYCTYCIVPFTRGKEKSRAIDEVVSDVARLVASGVREITLLGQNVNSFGKGGDESFPRLLRAIDADPRCRDLRRIRFTSSHPLDFSDELIACFASSEQGGVARLAAHLHLPVQSGSNSVLRKMGRHHDIETYIARMDRLRELSPEIGLSTDLIVGFPTETDEDFEATIRLLDRVRFDNIFAFAYSPRPGTRAARLRDDVPDEVKSERLNRVLKHQLKIAEGRYASRVGREMEILVEGEAKNRNIAARSVGSAPRASHAGRVWSGRTTCNRVVNFVSDAPRSLTGKFVNVRITGATALSLQGELLVEDRRDRRAGGPDVDRAGIL